MSRLGKSLKNRFLAAALAGAMVMSYMTSSSMTSPEMPVFAAESSEAELSEAESSVEISSSEVFEEAAEDLEAEQREPETEEAESKASEAESETAAKIESATAAETEDAGTEAEETQTEENTAASKKENRAASTVAKDKTLAKYNLEGYAASYHVTGGGLLTVDDDNYYIADTEEKFLSALASAGGGAPTVIEITRDMDLGNPVNSARWLHPTLQKTGVSGLFLSGANLTIFSKNGSAIKHCCIRIDGARNLIIRNITFDELWEWDEATSGEYDVNDWDYITIQGSDGIWIDHCTFYKAYDGVVDIKNPSSVSNVTVSWCRFLPGSKDDTFFNEMMDYLDAHKDEMPYYKSLLAEGLTKEQIWQYAYGQKKTSLLGQDDNKINAVGIKLTLANNYYLDSMERLPRLRYGTVHEYNCVLDSQDLYDWRNSNEILKNIITSNGAISTCDGSMLLENCYIKGIENPLVSGNAQSRPGYINAVDSLYYIGETNKTDELAPKNNNYGNYTGDRTVLVTDPEEFISALPYSDYVKYEASSLNDDIVPLTGAGSLVMSRAQWVKTSYSPTEEAETDETSGNEESNGDENSSTGESSGDKSSSTEESSNNESSSTEESSNNENSSTEESSEGGGIQIVGLNKRVYEYTGDKIIPEFDVYDGKKLLAPGVDYTVTYKDNKEPGTATIIVKGKGNYAADKKNEAKAVFEIIAVDDAAGTALANIKGAKISRLDDVDYSGTAYNPPAITLTLKNKTEVSYTYNTDTAKYEKAGTAAMDVNIAVSNNVNKGTASVLVSGVDDKGKPVKIKGKFKIKPLDLSKETVVIEAANAVYSPNGAVPESLTVTCKGKELKPGRDYTVKYSNNKNVGDAAVTITGKGNYTKNKTEKYNVGKADMSGFTVAAVTAHDGIKQAGKIKATVVDKNGNALKAKQYKLEIYHVDENDGVKMKGAQYKDTDPLEAGKSIYVEAVAANDTNLKAETRAKPEKDTYFTVGKDISKAKFTFTPNAKKGKEYKGSRIELTKDDFESVTYKGEPDPLVMSTDDGKTGDYVIVSYTNNINKGTATAVIKGIGKYSGTKTIKFKISQKAITSIKALHFLHNLI